MYVISQHPLNEPFAPGVNVYLFPFRGALGYFTMVPGVRRLLKRLRPDIVNAHYASGYGTTARLVGYRPWVLSVWGSDVYDFPYKSPLHRWLVQKNIMGADAVASTSHCMAEQTRNIACAVGTIAITPFGVDMEQFQGAIPVSQAQPERWVIGTVKTMADKYGIDTLIQAFALLLGKLQQSDAALAAQLQLRLVGGGPQTYALQQLAAQLGVINQVEFVGQVPYAQVPYALASFDIYVALSRLDSESFGVAIIEAGAAARPVVVSDAGGLPEVTIQGVTGIVVPRDNPQAAADAIDILLRDENLRLRMAAAAQQHVAQNYSWSVCVTTMLRMYGQTVKTFEARTNNHEKNLNHRWCQATIYQGQRCLARASQNRWFARGVGAYGSAL